MAENTQYWNQLISKGIRLLQEQNNDAAVAVLKQASFDVEHTYHDSWRWGTDYWALILSLRKRDYEALGDNRDQIERDIMSALVTFQKKSRDLLSTVTIRPAPEQSIEQNVDQSMDQSIGRSIDQSLERNMGFSTEQNMERGEGKRELRIQRAAKDAELLIREGRYDLAFDCIYSAYSDYFRQLLTKQDKSYEADDRARSIIQSAEEIINTINEVRHNNTAAHPDGQMLEKREAQLAIGLASSIVDYIEAAE
jgi:hypothetical protein